MKKILVMILLMAFNYLYSVDIFLNVNNPIMQYNDSNFRTISDAVEYASENYNDTLYTIKIEIFENPEMINNPVYEDGAYRENVVTSGLCCYEFYSRAQNQVIIYPLLPYNPVISLLGGGFKTMKITNITFHNDSQYFYEYNIGINIKSPKTVIENCRFITGRYRSPFTNDIKLVHDNQNESYEKELFVNNCLFDTSLDSYIDVPQIECYRISCSLIGDKTYITTYTFHGNNNRFINTGPAVASTGTRNIFWKNNYSELRYCDPTLPTFLFSNCDFGNGIICTDNLSRKGGFEILSLPRFVSLFAGNIFNGFRFAIDYPSANYGVKSKFINNVIETFEDSRFSFFLNTFVSQDTISNNNFLNEVNTQGNSHQLLTIASNLQIHNNIFSNYEFLPINFVSQNNLVSNMFNNCSNTYNYDLNITGEPIFENTDELDFSLVWPNPAIGNGYSSKYDDDSETGFDMKLLTYKDDTIDIGAIPFEQDRKQYHHFDGGTTTKNWTGFPALDPDNETTIDYGGITQTLPNNNMIVMFKDFNDQTYNGIRVDYLDWNEFNEYFPHFFYWLDGDDPEKLVEPYIGYKIRTQNDIGHWFGGLMQDADVDIPLPMTSNGIWLGYQVPFTSDALVAFNEILGCLQMIKHKDWALYWNGTRWTGKTSTGNTNLEIGDFVEIKYRSNAIPPTAFNWTYPAYSNPNSFKYQDATYVIFEEKSDYTPFFIDIQENSNIEELALYADEECIGGAKTQGETTVMVKAFMEGVPDDSEISIEIFTGAKSSIKVKHLAEFNSKLQVWDYTDNIIKDRRDYYHVSLTKDDSSIIETNQIVTTNYPNPFNPETTIEFNNPVQGQVSVNIYNLKGQLVKNLLQDNLNQGVHKVVWQGRDSNEQQVASGVYFYKISAGQKKSVTHKIILMK